MKKPIKLDRLDQKILKIVQNDNRTPHREIAEQIGLSSPAVTRRLQRLRDREVIRGDTALLNSKAIGRPLSVIVHLSVISEFAAELTRLREALERCPQIQHCYYVTGDVDFILLLNVADMEEYEKLTKNLFIEKLNVKRYVTFVAMDTVKANSEVMLTD